MYKREGTKSPKSPRNVKVSASLKPFETAGHRFSLLTEKEKSLPSFAFGICVDEFKEKMDSSESIDETLAAAAMVAMEKELRVDTTKKASGAEEISAASAMAANNNSGGVTGIEKTMAAAVPSMAASSVVEMELRRINSIGRAMGHKVPATVTAADEESRGVTAVEKTSAFNVSASAQAMAEGQHRLPTVEKGSSTEVLAMAPNVAADKEPRGLPTTKMVAKKPQTVPTDKQSRGLGNTGRASSSSGGETAVSALETKAKGVARATERMNESGVTINPKASVSSSLEQKRKVVGLSPRSAGDDKRRKLEVNKPTSGSSASFSVGCSPSAIEGSGGVVGKRRRGRPLGSKNKPKDKDNVKDKKCVKGSGAKAGGGVKKSMVKTPHLKTAGSSGTKISGSTCIPPKANVGADGKAPGSTGVKASGTAGIKRPESLGTKTQNSRAGLVGKSSGSVGIKSPKAIGVRTSGPKARIGGKESCLAGVRIEGSKCAKTSGSKAGSGVKATPGPIGVGAPKINTAQSPDKSPGPKKAADAKSLEPPGGKAAEPPGVNNPAGPATGEASDTTANVELEKTPNFKAADLKVAESIGVKPPEPADGGNTTISSIVVDSERKAIETAPGSKSGGDGKDEDIIEGEAVRTDADERESTTTSGSLVSLPTAEEKQTAESRDSAGEKAVGASGQEAPRPPSRDRSCVSCVSEGDVAREKKSRTLAAEDLVVTPEMARQKRKMACCSEYAELTHLPQDEVEDSSDGWSEGDKVIGEVEDACASKVISMAGEGECENDATGSISSGEASGMEVERQKEKEVERGEDVGCVRRKLGSKEHGSELTVSTVTDKEVDGTLGGFSSLWGGRSGRTFAGVTQAPSLTKSPVMSPVRRRKKRKSSVDEYSTTGGSGGGNSGSHIEDGEIKEKKEDGTSLGKGKRKGEEIQEGTKEDDEETKEESGVTVPEMAAEPQPPSPSSSRKGSGKKIGKVMKNRIRDLAAGAILPVGNRRKRAASLPGGSTSTTPYSATASTSRGAVTSMRRRRSVDNSRGANVGGGSSVTRSSRDRSGSGGDKSGSSGSSVPLRHSSRAAAAAATAALTGVFSSPYSS